MFGGKIYTDLYQVWFDHLKFLECVLKVGNTVLSNQRLFFTCAFMGLLFELIVERSLLSAGKAP